MRSRYPSRRYEEEKENAEKIDRLVETLIIITGFVFTGIILVDQQDVQLIGLFAFLSLFSAIVTRAGHVILKKWDTLNNSYKGLSIFFPLMIASFFILSDILLPAEGIEKSHVLLEWFLVLLLACLSLTIALQTALMSPLIFKRDRTLTLIFEALLIWFFLASVFFKKMDDDFETIFTLLLLITGFILALLIVVLKKYEIIINFKNKIVYMVVIFTKNMLNTIKKKLFQLRSHFLIWNNQRKLFIKVETRNKIPRLILHEKHESKIKWTSRILTLAAICTSLLVIAFPFNILLSIGLFILQQIFEKIIFSFTTLYVQPIPEWDSEEWLGMIFGIPLSGDLYKLGMLFKTEEYARKTFDCIRAWNYNLDDDSEDNIKISFITNNNGRYFTYIYPSFERDSIKTARDDADLEMFRNQQLKEQNQLIGSIIICKEFEYNSDSFFNKFQLSYNDGSLIEFKPYYLESQEVKELDISPIMKNTVKIKKMEELTEFDLEYHHRNLIVPILD